MTEGLICRAPRPEDRERWDALFTGYLDFYRVPQEDRDLDVVWDWLLDPQHLVRGLLAVLPNGEIIGLAHFHEMPYTLRASRICYLSDLFVDPTVRGKRIGQTLIDAVLAVCREEGWTSCRWLTADDNYSGRSLYDRFSPKSPFIAYMVSPTTT